ncbi:MBL fold metallo-hydrolase [Gordonia sp. (in: high G+C Gram-positive bacteria)]|uniref:MBL fold metallo-hydrolase n=1 Tax=Gordonia sp. (in: high G+C Gram-positive bacteria) TaxID=84139 RepID=UPI00168F7FD1|nr:MBL fold metallo-hydrolase [Gordonia sp. (in: high G+C Gram-positive bacteria)]NLG46500.1 MBL fold metallo-hydrolase [Gordonia sp. (in: high G+C Gram-positive bacteria)]
MAPDVPNTESAPEIASGDAGATPAHPAYGVLREVTPFASVLLCNNPGAFELDGTNTWILRAPDSETSVVVDPGPAKHGKHVRAVAKAAGEVELVLISHRHHDHVGACKKMRKLTGAPQRAYTDKYSDNAPRLRDREVIKAAGLTITVMHTPGHTADSVSFLVEWEGQRALLSGDTILGFGTTVLDPTDGTLTDYFNSINRVIVDASDAALLPAHGPDHPEVGPIARYYKTHREERLAQIVAALDDMGVSPEDAKPMKVVRKVYADIDKKLWPAAKMSVKTQLEYLRTL